MNKLHLFLENAKRSFEDPSVGSVTVVMGNEASDMDSVVTSIIYAYFCNFITGGVFVPLLSIPSEDLKLRTDQFYLYDRLGFNSGLVLGFNESLEKRLEQLQAEDKLRFIITDHNELKGYFKKFAGLVTEVIDHHVDSGLYTNNPNVKVQIEMVGSATSLVAEKIIAQAKDLITKEIATLLLAPILIDTINLEPSRNRVTPKDSAAATVLLEISQVNQLEFFNQLQAAKFNDDALGTVDKLRKDYKGGQVGSFKYGISAVLASVEQWLAKEKQLTQQFEAFMKQNGLELLFATLAYYDQENKFHRELIVYGRNGKHIVDKLPAEFKLREMHSERTKQAVELNSNTDQALLFYHIENIDVARKVLQPAVDQVLKAFSSNI